ncbi:uroplakin-2 [Pelobates cultripes]|uniref:Uroplakin-2 n=1 Tax=Pelobates cultripes TaxID=61616 RepID=A0AAD1T674_PELCU|nr:uroplakin-2 [Pelobates cultripes]
MQLFGIVSTLFFIFTFVEAQNTTLSSDVLANVYARSAIIALPGCTYSGKSANLKVITTSNNTVLTNINFTVPQCRLKRDLVVINSAASGNVQTVNVGYQVKSLLPSTNYVNTSLCGPSRTPKVLLLCMAFYIVENTLFTNISFTTNSDSASPSVTFARSGGMVVITVLLSIAMVLLVVLLIVALVMKGGLKK